MNHALTRILFILAAAALWLYLPPPARFQARAAGAQAEEQAVSRALQAVLFEGPPRDGRFSPAVRDAAYRLAGEILAQMECKEATRPPSPSYRCVVTVPDRSWPSEGD